MSVVGLDLSLTATGVADENGARVLRAAKGVVGIERLVWLRMMLAIAIGQNRDIDGANPLVVIEGYSFASVHSQAHALGELGGVVRVMLFEAGAPFVDVAPKALKKFATDNGNANKTAMAMAAQRCGYEGPADDDCVDAWWLREMGLYAQDFGTARLGCGYRDEAVAKIAWPSVVTSS